MTVTGFWSVLGLGNNYFKNFHLKHTPLGYQKQENKMNRKKGKCGGSIACFFFFFLKQLLMAVRKALTNLLLMLPYLLTP